MKKNIFLIALLLMVTSCTHWLDLRPDEFETEEYYKKTILLDMGIDELAEVIESYKINHPYDYDIRYLVGKTNKNARVWWIPGGLNSGTMALVSFKSISKKKIEAKIYAGNVFWVRRPELFVRTLIDYKEYE